MSTDALPRPSFGPAEQLQLARHILQREAGALSALAARLGEPFLAAVQRVLRCQGAVIVTGIGKAGLVGQKIAATLASTGTRSHFLHPAEAVHGDLGRISPHDVVLVLSKSGETEEIARLLPALNESRAPIVAITGSASSTLGRAAAVVIELGPLEEACPHGLAPTTSTTAMLGVGDALALVVSRARNFRRDDFRRLHPGGDLGRRLTRVEQAMRPISQCRVAHDSLAVREVFVAASRPGRRTGAIMIVDEKRRLAGLFTDSDLARLLERRLDRALDRPIREVMTRSPRAIEQGAMLSDAVAILVERKISELPVVDGSGRPVGLIDITDVMGLVASEDRAAMRRTTTIAGPTPQPPSQLRVVHAAHGGPPAAPVVPLPAPKRAATPEPPRTPPLRKIRPPAVEVVPPPTPLPPQPASPRKVRRVSRAADEATYARPPRTDFVWPDPRERIDRFDSAHD